MPHFNNRTNKKRRRPTYSTSRNNRIEEALYSIDQQILDRIHSDIFKALATMIQALQFYLYSIVIEYFELLDIIDIEMLVNLSSLYVAFIYFQLQRLLHNESEHGDLDPEDELPRGHALNNRIRKNLNDYTDHTLWSKTNFLCHEIELLIRFFRLRELCYPDGFIRIESGNNTNMYYMFLPDEIMLFVLIKMKSADTNIEIVDNNFGGDHRKWSIAFHWFLEYSTPIVRDLIGLQLLSRFRNRFGEFASKIADRMAHGFYVQSNEGGEYEFVDGIQYNDPNDPFRVFGLLDCSMFKTNTPRTGPSDRFEGSARFDDADLQQRAVYTGWKKFHGIKVMTVVMANGLHAVYGPISVRRNDIDAVQSADLDQRLNNMQQGQVVKYCVFGDGIFKVLATADSTIRSYHKEQLGAPLTDIERHENIVMRKIRVEIEHAYGDITKYFDLTDEKKEWKIRNGHSAQKLNLLFFLSNCITCIRGNSVTRKFDCFAPSLEEYLFPEQ